MLQALKNFLYDLVVWSGIINVIIPYTKYILAKMLLSEDKISNFVLTDDSGATLKLTSLNGRFYPPFQENRIGSIGDLRIRKDDVILCGYPKTGCHWMHEIMHMLVTGKAELTKHGKALGGMIDLVPNIIIDSLHSPRVLNSHLLYEELPRAIKENKTKIVFTTRNPKDTVVSFYNHTLNLYQVYCYKGKFNDYFKLFMEGKLDYGSYFDYTLDWDNVMKTQTDNPILLVRFEDMKANPLECVHKVAKFLEIPITDRFASEIVAACKFNRMKEKRAHMTEAKLFRKGIVGDWKNWLSDEQSEAIDRVWKERMQECSYQPTY